MGSPLKKIPGATGFLNFTSKTNALNYLLGRKEGGKLDLAGQLAGVYDGDYKPANVSAIPTGDGTGTSADAAALIARDRERRLARRAAGLDSTIRTSPAGAALYSAQPKTLLGS